MNGSMPALAISLLGPFSVQIGDLPLASFRSKSAAALLIVLAVEARPLRREWLVELLWPEMPAGAGRKNLRQTLYELRQAITQLDEQAVDSPQPLILADRQTIQINEAIDHRLDTAEFSARLKTNDSDSLHQAVALYRGDFLADFYLPDNSAFEDWAAAKRALFRRLALDAMDQLAQDALQQGNYDQAADLARRQLGIDNLRETAVRQLMVALALNGRRNEALAQYEASRAELDQELGVEPEPATQAVYERIVSGEILPAGNEILTLLAHVDEAPPVPRVPQEAPRSNLPAEPTPFVGREREVADVTGRLLDPTCRLLTLLGPGGCGKSRLAIQVARRFPLEQTEEYPDGVCYASLIESADVDNFVSTLVNGLSFTAFDPTSDLRAQLLSYLRGRQMLLLLDNMEYMQDPAAGRFLSELLDQSPGVKALACSRTRLNLRAEELFPVAGLDVPQSAKLPPEAVADYSAVQLFVNSARRVRPDFSLTTDTIPPTLSICRQLQGIPLAIELAASWIEVLSPAEVDKEIARCLDFLETDWLDMPERQRSLRTVFETSWRLLNGQERATFLRLSVFRGGFDYPTARQIADAGQRTLLGLINKSWLQRDESGRYLAHEMLRQYAYQLLSDDDLAWESAHDRHSAYFVELAHAQGELLKGPQQVAATERIDAELENITAAWQWLVGRERYETVIERMLPGLFLYFAARSRGQWLVSLVTGAQRQLESAPTRVEPTWQVILLTVQAAFLNGFLISRYFITEVYPPSGQEKISAAYALAHAHKLEDRLGLWSLMLAILYGWAFDKTEARQWLLRLVEVHRDGDSWLLAFTLENLGGLLLPTGLGRPAGQAGTVEADQYLEEAVSLFEKLGDRREKGYTLKLWGLLSRAGDFSDAKRMLLAAQHDLEIAGDPVMATQILGFLASLCILRGEIEEGFEYSRRARQESARLGHDHFESGALSWESIWALRLDTVDHARKARQEALAIARKTGDALNLVWGTWELGEIERVAGNYELSQDLFDQARELFMPLEEPYAPAFLERGLGDLAYDLGRYEKSLSYFEESLSLATQVSHQWSSVYAYFGMGRAALALARNGQESQLGQAQAYILEGLQSAYYHRYRDQYAIGVTELADCYTVSGRAEEALRLAQVVLASPITWQETRKRAKRVQEAILADRPDLLDRHDLELPDILSLMPELLAATQR